VHAILAAFFRERYKRRLLQRHVRCLGGGQLNVPQSKNCTLSSLQSGDGATDE
jgi:hypothetical protein